MFSTWDRSRGTAALWERKDRQHAHSLGRFIATVDRMFYMAVAALAVAILALLIVE
jgi:hypothetical protein